MMRDCEQDLMDILTANESLNLEAGKSLFGGPVPERASDSMVHISLDSGTGEPYHGGSRDLWRATLHVQVRGPQDAYKATLDRCNMVFSTLHRAQTNVYASILCPNLPTFEDEDEKGRPVFGFDVEVAFTSQRAGDQLVVLEGNGNLDVESVTFPDGTSMTSAADFQHPVNILDVPVGEDAFRVPGGTFIRYGDHPNAYLRGYSGDTNGTLLVQGGAQLYGCNLYGKFNVLPNKATAPGRHTGHSNFSGRMAIPAGESSVVLYSNLLSTPAVDRSAVYISPVQIDPAVKTWSVHNGPGSFEATITIDAPCSTDWWFNYMVLS